MEDTTNLHKKMIQTLSCQTLVPPLVLIYDPVRDSQTPADKKRKKRITGLVHGQVIKMYYCYHSTGHPGKSSKQHTWSLTLCGGRSNQKSGQSRTPGQWQLTQYVGQGPRRSKRTIFRNRHEEVWRSSTQMDLGEWAQNVGHCESDPCPSPDHPP